METLRTFMMDSYREENKAKRMKAVEDDLAELDEIQLMELFNRALSLANTPGDTVNALECRLLGDIATYGFIKIVEKLIKEGRK